MFQISLGDKLPYNEFAELLNEGSPIYVDADRIQEESERLSALIQSRHRQLVTAIYGVNYVRLNHVSKQSIINYLIDVGVPEEFFCKRGGYEPSYYNEKVRTKIITRGYANEVFWLYDSYCKLQYTQSKIRKFMERNIHKQREEGNLGESLIPMTYNVVPTKNLRFSTANENPIGFYGEMRSSFTAPEGYYILSCDFPQIDARAALNMYLKNEYLDKLSYEVEDTYLLFKEYARHIRHEKDKYELEQTMKLDYYVDKTALEERIEKYNPNVLPFASKAARDIYKVTALKTAYYARYSAIPSEHKAIRELTDMYESTERYRRILKMTELLFSYGIPIEITSRWGHKRLIVEHDLRATLSSVFNAPIQTTSSEIIIFFVTKFIKYFRDLGIGPEGVRIALNRHDEPIFYIKKEVFHEHAPFIASMRTVLVEGWAPIHLDMFIGNSYKKSLPECISDLNRYPDERAKAALEANKFKNQEEPYALIEPKIIYMNTLKFKDGSMRVSLVWQEGELSNDLYLDKGYTDKRKFRIELLSIKEENLYNYTEMVQDIINAHSKKDTFQGDYLVMSPIGLTKDIIISNRTAYFRNLGHTTGHLLGESALVTLGKKLELLDIGYDEQRYLDYLEANKELIQR